MTQGSPFTSIRQLSSGRFQARWRPRNDEHKSATLSTREECEEWLAAVEKTVREKQRQEAFERLEWAA